VIVVGAGFSGLLSAVHLLRGSADVAVVLVERRDAFGPGTAYDTGNADHLLNVRLGNMSAFPEEPDHLSVWLAQQPSWQASSAFITRGTYGAYLRDLLGQAIADNPGRLTLERGAATDLEPVGDGWRLHLADGRTIDGDAVILAIGNQEPSTPPGVDEALRGSRLYVENPWSGRSEVPEDARQVLLIGTGLTAVDVAIALQRPGRTVTALSRHGLLPRAHATVATPAADLSFSGSPAEVLRQARQAAAERDWREVFDALRHRAIGLWRSWEQLERLQFIRHLRPMWEVHRHRLAPTIANNIASLIAEGALVVVSGKLGALTLDGHAVDVTYRPRGRRRVLRRRFDAVVNCTGPLGRISESREPLIVNLLRRGLAEPDPLGLGFRVDGDGVLQVGVEQPRNLHVVGPLGRGAFWEMTSVPDLRGQAQVVATRVLGG